MEPTTFDSVGCDMDKLKSVEMIASGYEWECPYCGAFNKEIEVNEMVVCSECHSESRVQDYYHAYGNR